MAIKSYPKNKHVKLRGAAYVKFAQAVMKRDGWHCVRCGNPFHLTVGHKIHRGMGGGHGPGDVPENAETICMDCHDKEERALDGMLKK